MLRPGRELPPGLQAVLVPWSFISKLFLISVPTMVFYALGFCSSSHLYCSFWFRFWSPFFMACAPAYLRHCWVRTG